MEENEIQKLLEQIKQRSEHAYRHIVWLIRHLARTA